MDPSAALCALLAATLVRIAKVKWTVKFVKLSSVIEADFGAGVGCVVAGACGGVPVERDPCPGVSQ